MILDEDQSVTGFGSDSQRYSVDIHTVHKRCHALAIKRFVYSLFWLGQGVTRVGILVSLFLRWCGS
jgi:hypothetical protein